MGIGACRVSTDTAAAADALRGDPERLRAARTRMLEGTRSFNETLTDLGVRTVGELAALPFAGAGSAANGMYCKAPSATTTRRFFPNSEATGPSRVWLRANAAPRISSPDTGLVLISV